MLGCALAAFVVWACGAGSAAAQLAVDQAEVILQPSAAGGAAFAINVTNEGDRVVEATVYIEDWDRQENGDNRFFPNGSQPHSCAPFLKVFPLSLRIPPKAAQAVRLALEGADTLHAACWSIVFVESGGPVTDAGRRVTYVTRLGVKVYGVPPGLPRDGVIEAMLVRPRQRGPGAVSDSGGQELVVSFRNSGGVPLVVRGSVEFRRADNSVAATAELDQFPVLPGALRTVLVRIPALRLGRYVALALLDFGGPEIVAGQVELSVP